MDMGILNLQAENCLSQVNRLNLMWKKLANDDIYEQDPFF